MKSFYRWIRQARTKISALPLFKKSLFWSVCLHALFLYLLSSLILLFETSLVNQPPLVFDFVFAPSSELNQASEGYKHEDREETGKRMSPENNFEDIQPNVLKPLPSVTEDADEISVEHEESIAVPDNKAVHSGSRFAIRQLVPSLPKLPRLRPVRTNRLQAKMALSPKQRKMLFKKFKKWTENLDRMGVVDSTLVWREKGKTYSATFRNVRGKSETDIEEVLVEVETEEDGYTLSTEMRMKRLAFSNFAQFVDFWDPRVALHDDELEGRFHSNTKINVSSSFNVKPKFYGKVTTSSYDIRTTGASFFDHKSVFEGGLETGVKVIHLPKHFLPFLDEEAFANEKTQELKGNTRITFYSDGSYSWRSADKGGKTQKNRLPDNSFYIIGDNKSTLYVKGTVRGKVLVYSPHKIIIDDDLTYARHPEISSNADDYLGLVSEKNIEIAHPNVTGPGDLNIYASIYAKRRFQVRHTNRKRGATLYIYGSLTAGSISATEPRYATRVCFDKRLEKKRAPGFPMTDRYEITEWDETWKVK